MGLGVVIVAVAGAARASPGVEIRDAVARVIIIPEARGDVAVSVVRANPRLPLKVRREGDTVVVDGGLGWRSPNCHGAFGRPAASVWGIGDIGWGEMPQVVVRTPMIVRVGAGGAVFGSIGRGAGVDLSNSGCGDWKVADQAGPLRVSLAGSGDVGAGTATSVDVHVSGSADVDMVAALGGLGVTVTGSGDIRLARVDGPMKVRVGGSGDVTVRGGAVTDLDVGVAGSGNVTFGGVARSLQVNVAGAGDVKVAKVTGPVSKHIVGSGDVTVGP